MLGREVPRDSDLLETEVWGVPRGVRDDGPGSEVLTPRAVELLETEVWGSPDVRGVRDDGPASEAPILRALEPRVHC